MLDRRQNQPSRTASNADHRKIYEPIQCQCRWLLIACLCGMLGAGCASSKPQTNANPNVQRTITYQGPIWVKKGQGQKFVQYKGPTWNSSGTPADAAPPAEPLTKPPAAK